MFVFTPRTRNSCRQRSIRRHGVDEPPAAGGDFHEQRIIKRVDGRPGERRCRASSRMPMPLAER